MFSLKAFSEINSKKVCSYYLDSYLSENKLIEVARLESREGVVKVDQAFRKKFLSASIDKDSRKLLVNGILADLKEESVQILKRISDFKLKNKIDEKSQVYDVLSIGAGVQDGIFQNSLTQFAPKLKAISIEESDTIANTFGMSPDFFRINSTNRSENFFVQARPGIGNINRLSGGSIQIPDLAPNKYPRAGSIQTATVLNRANSKAPVLFETKVLKVEDSYILNEKFPARYKVTIEYKGEEFTLFSNNIVVASGLGTESFRVFDRSTIKLINSERNKIKKLRTDSVKLPGIMTFNDARTISTFLDNPFRGYSGKKVMVIGNGDSGKVMLEYLFKEAPAEAYKGNNAQIGEVAGVIWAGATEQTCDEYIVGNRVRYSKIAAAIKSKSLVPIDSKVRIIEKVKGDKGYQVTFQSGEKRIVDHIISATGFDKKYGKLFSNITAQDKGDLQKAGLLEKIKKPLMGESEPVTVALKLKNIEKNKRKVLSQDIYVLGPTVNLLEGEPAELLEGVPQNSVSIFNNGDRTYSAGNMLATKIKPGNFSRLGKKRSIPFQNLKKVASEYKFKISKKAKINIKKSLYNEYYLLAKVSEKLERFKLSEINSDLKIKILKSSRQNEYIFQINISSPQVEEMVAAFKNDDEIISMIRSYIEENKKNTLDFDIVLKNNNVNLAESTLSIYKIDKKSISQLVSKGISLPNIVEGKSKAFLELKPIENLIKKNKGFSELNRSTFSFNGKNYSFESEVLTSTRGTKKKILTFEIIDGSLEKKLISETEYYRPPFLGDITKSVIAVSNEESVFYVASRVTGNGISGQLSAYVYDSFKGKFLKDIFLKGKEVTFDSFSLNPKKEIILNYSYKDELNSSRKEKLKINITKELGDI